MSKKQKYVLVEHKSNLNCIIKNACQSSDRIKFTYLDVSPNYIVFGATSGGLFIFKRYPHVLLKLIPNRHGAVAQLAISPNEKSMALSTSRGVIVIITNCFLSNDFQYHLYSEDKNCTITAIKWNNNNEELYYGNNLGKVAVITVPGLLTKAIFQTPCASLMHLDSSINQIDCYSTLLLVSTLTRTYLCNTEKEHFIQIGKKLRNGKFGACFFVNKEADKIIETEHITPDLSDFVKIFCNRPKARLWEAELDACVTCTHQLKDFFEEDLQGWICLNDNSDTHSNTFRVIEHKLESQESLNFTKMLVLQDKFILTFNTEGFYIFDPETVTVIYRYNNFNNIREVKLTKNFIYVYLKNRELQVFGLYSLENIILKTLFNQQYHACVEICINYYKEVLELVESSDRIYLLTVLENKLCKCFTTETVDSSLRLIMDAIQSLSKKKLSEKLNNGIVVVNNTYFNENILNETSSLEVKQVTEEEICSKDEIDDSENSDNYLKILLQQYEWSRINDRIKISKYKSLLDIKDHNKIVVLFQNFNEFMSEKNTDVQLWSYNSYLGYFANLNYEELIENYNVDDNSLQFLLKGYTAINYSCLCSCACSYPLPTASINKPQFYNIGCVLVKKLYNTNTSLYEELIRDVPFMWKYVAEHLRYEDDIKILLPLLMQFNDEDLFSVFLNKFKYDTWDNAIQMLIKLQQKKCINCETEFDTNCCVIKWAQLASHMIQSIGAQSTVNLLKHYAEFITSKDLDAKFYQSCIFAAAFDNFGMESKAQASLLSKTMANDALPFDELIAKFLSDKYKAANHKHSIESGPFLKRQL